MQLNMVVPQFPRLDFFEPLRWIASRDEPRAWSAQRHLLPRKMKVAFQHRILAMNR
jgi:hypothetical protein